MPRRRILVVGYAPPPATGQAVATIRLAETLADLGNDVELHDLGGPRRSVAVRSSQLRSLREALSGQFQFRRLLARWSPDVVVYTALSPRLAGHLRDRLIVGQVGQRAPVIGVVHWGDFDSLFPRGRPAVSTKLLTSMAAVVFLAPSLADRSRRACPGLPARVIANGIPGPCPVRSTEVSVGDDAQLLFVGSMLPGKGYQEAVLATGHLAELGTDVRIRLVGPWPDQQARRRLQAVCDAHSWGWRVELVGPQPPEMVEKLMLESDLLVAPTRYRHEAQPLVVIEALRCGLPVVATRQGALAELVGEGRGGILVDDVDPATLGAAISAALEVGARARLSAEARRQFMRAHADHVIGRAWCDLLSEVAPNAPDGTAWC